MQAIEIESMTDGKGDLKLNYHLHQANKAVKVLILIDNEEENKWIKAISGSPKFKFLQDESENIYSIENGTHLKK